MSQIIKGAGGNLAQIQELVDDLAKALGRSVAVDNPAFELVCASAQIGVIDDRRIAAIIDRSPPPEPVPWMLSFGIQEATRPVRLPAHSELGMLPRVCFALRFRDRLCGYLWLFDEPAVSQQELEEAQAAAVRISQLLGSSSLPSIARASTIRALVSEVLGGATGSIQHAVNEGYLPEEGEDYVHYFNLVDTDEEIVLEHLLLELGRVYQPRPFLVAEMATGLIVIERQRRPADFSRIQEEISRAGSLVGFSIESVGSAQLASSPSAQEASHRVQFLSDVASLLSLGVNPLSWDEADTWRLLYGWDLSYDTVKELSPEAHRLIVTGTSGQLETALTYLNNARSVALTSKELFIHRATLHYRLERIREIIGGVLDDGWKSMVFHVALQLNQALNLK